MHFLRAQKKCSGVKPAKALAPTAVLRSPAAVEPAVQWQRTFTVCYVPLVLKWSGICYK
jgi:hypothetical protein